MKETVILILLVLISVYISRQIIVKSAYWRKKTAGAIGLVAVLGVANGAIIAGLLALIDLVKYHY